MTAVPFYSDYPEDSYAYRRQKEQHVFEEFCSQFPEERDSLKELLGGPDIPYECRHCGSFEVEELEGNRVIKCIRCGKETWLTAGTFFQNVRHPRAWHGAIFFIENGVSNSIASFARRFEIAFSSAWEIYKKLSIIIETQVCENVSYLPSAPFRSVFSRRSRETPAQGHPKEEEETSLAEDSAHQPTAGLSAAPPSNFRLKKHGSRQKPPAAMPKEPAQEEPTGVEKEVLELLASGPLTFDALLEGMSITPSNLLSMLSMMELKALLVSSGNRYERVHPGNNVRAYPPDKTSRYNQPTSLDFSFAGKFIQFVKEEYHGISRKYLQFYLFRYWCFTDQARWTVGVLMNVCRDFRDIHISEIVGYVTPARVRVIDIRTRA